MRQRVRGGSISWSMARIRSLNRSEHDWASLAFPPPGANGPSFSAPLLATNALMRSKFAGERVMKIRENKRGGKWHHKPAIAAVAVGALLSFQAGTARADDVRQTRVRRDKGARRIDSLEEH